MIHKALFSENKVLDTLTPETLHLYHCLEYLALAISCAGDTTLEKVNVLKSDEHIDAFLVDEAFTWGRIHTCRNIDTIFDFAEANSVDSYI